MGKRWEELSEMARSNVRSYETARQRGQDSDEFTALHLHDRILRDLSVLTPAESAALKAMLTRIDAPMEPAMRVAQHEERLRREDAARALVALFTSIAAFVARGAEGERWGIGFERGGRWHWCGSWDGNEPGHQEYTFANEERAIRAAAQWTEAYRDGNSAVRVTYSVRPLPVTP